MRDIAHGFFEASPAMLGPLVALVLFFLVFAAVTYRVLRSRASDWTNEASMPLSDDGTRPIPSHDGETR